MLSFYFVEISITQGIMYTALIDACSLFDSLHENVKIWKFSIGKWIHIYINVCVLPIFMILCNIISTHSTITYFYILSPAMVWLVYGISWLHTFHGRSLMIYLLQDVEGEGVTSNWPELWSNSLFFKYEYFFDLRKTWSLPIFSSSGTLMTF